MENSFGLGATPDYLRALAEPSGFSLLKPTNSEFIALIAEKLQLQMKSLEVANCKKESIPYSRNT